MPVPPDVRFLKSHEWARKDGDLIAVGVSDYAIDQLNKEIVFLELPPVGRNVSVGAVFGVIEAVKAASDLYSPVAGKVVEVNESLPDNPTLLADDPYGAGWMIKVAPSSPADMDALLSVADYQKFCETEAHH
ncbi:MAG: glycine cleavage system protein GcvH [Candidatus Sumerlaeaceae bacterium]|nr:glycine cleavage system protein GcvH [Candidatus Sumerlaeaceae bacterium]